MDTNGYFFSDEDYGKILDNFVIGCVDVVVFFEKRLLLLSVV